MTFSLLFPEPFLPSPSPPPLPSLPFTNVDVNIITIIISNKPMKRASYRLSLLLFFFLLSETAAQPHPRTHTTLSTTSPITKALSDPTLSAPTKSLITLIRTISTTIDQRISNNDSQACNLRVAPWLSLQQADLEARKLGLLERTCQSQLHLSDAVSRKQLPRDYFNTARETLRVGALALARGATPFVEAELNWSSLYPVRGWDVMKGGQSCNLETATAYRVEGVWYIRAVTTNHPVDAFQPESRRSYVEEFVKEDLTEALRSLHRDRDDILRNGTTLLLQQGGKAEFSSVEMGDTENPALVEALRLNALAVDQATDAVTPSNVAILSLPMIMALVPVAFIAELNTFATLMYIVFTDLISGMPFLIKGIELTNTGVVNRGELVAYHLGNSTLGVMEVWAAECHGDDSFRILGIVFIIIALSVMTTGILFEHFAWKWMGRKGKLGNGPFGEVFAMNRYTVFERTVEDDCDDYGEEIVKGRRRWRIRWTGRWRYRKRDDDLEEG